MLLWNSKQINPTALKQAAYVTYIADGLHLPLEEQFARFS